MKNSHIEWTDHTFNPWEGCTKVSPGCVHCYAETRNKRFGGGTAPNWGKGAPRRRTSVHNWNEPVRWNAAAAKDGTHPRVFCASLADWLDDEVPASWLFDLITLIHKTPNLNWLLLTKRPANWEKRLRAAAAQCTIDPLDITDRIYAWIEGSRIWHNIWIGTTVEDQARANERIPALMDIPAKVRFLSCEPLIGPVNLDIPGMNPLWGGTPGGERIHWVIAGGESGPVCRPMHPDWARSLRDQCKAAGTAFLFKQWGEYAPKDVAENFDATKADLIHIDDTTPMFRIGKKLAGRLLDNVDHRDFPTTDCRKASS